MTVAQQIFLHEKEKKKEEKKRKILEKQIANEELKKVLLTQKLVKKFNLRNKLNKSSVHKTFNT